MPEYVSMCLNKQDSEYASGPKICQSFEYGKIQNMTGFSICER